MAPVPVLKLAQEGSPETEKYRGDDESPQVEVEVGNFWMGKAEVSWDEFLAFYAERFDTVECDATFYRSPSPRTSPTAP